jgi:hypothetical protein
LEEYSYISTALWATTGPVTGLLYLYLYKYRSSQTDDTAMTGSLAPVMEINI